MDLRAYYTKMREVEAGLPEPCVVVSRQTTDGGKDGVHTEVSRTIAARMILNGTAREATEEETRAFREATDQAKRTADQLAAASRMQLVLAQPYELRSTRGTGKAAKE